MVALAILNGIMSAAWNSMLPVSVTYLFGVQNLNLVYSMLLGFYGIASFLGPPMLGYLFDHHFDQNYEATMAVAGSLYGVSALLGTLSYFLHRRENFVPDIDSIQ